MVGGPYFDLGAMAAHIIGVLAVLAERVSESGSDAALGEGARILLLQHVLLLSKLFEPGVFQGLTCSYSVIRVVN